MERMQQLESLLAEDPKNSFIRFAIAKEFESLEKVDKALAAYESLRIDDPNYVGLYYHYAKLLEKKSEFDPAIEIYKTGMAIAKQLGDKHAYGEMESALWEISED